MGMGWDGKFVKAWISIHREEGKDAMCLRGCFPRQTNSQTDRRSIEVELG